MENIIIYVTEETTLGDLFKEVEKHLFTHGTEVKIEIKEGSVCVKNTK